MSEIIKFRASQVGKLMGSPRDKKAKENNELSQTAKSYIEEVWLEKNYGYREILYTPELLKGNLCQQDSFELVQKVLGGEFRVENKDNLQNYYITGRPDIILKDTVEDTKTCYTIKGFFNAEMSDLYYYQGLCYMKLTGRKHFRLIFCLVNTPAFMILEQQKKYFFMFNCDEENPDYIKASKQLEINHNFDNIPPENRLKIFNFDFIESEYSQVEEKCIKANEYYSTLKL